MPNISKVFTFLFPQEKFKELSFGKKVGVCIVSALPAITLFGIITSPFIWRGMVFALSDKKIKQISSQSSSESEKPAIKLSGDVGKVAGKKFKVKVEESSSTEVSPKTIAYSKSQFIDLVERNKDLANNIDFNSENLKNLILKLNNNDIKTLNDLFNNFLKEAQDIDFDQLMKGKEDDKDYQEKDISDIKIFAKSGSLSFAVACQRPKLDISGMVKKGNWAIGRDKSTAQTITALDDQNINQLFAYFVYENFINEPIDKFVWMREQSPPFAQGVIMYKKFPH